VQAVSSLDGPELALVAFGCLVASWPGIRQQPALVGLHAFVSWMDSYSASQVAGRVSSSFDPWFFVLVRETVMCEVESVQTEICGGSRDSITSNSQLCAKSPMLTELCLNPRHQ
jgi:hypothetical protein